MLKARNPLLLVVLALSACAYSVHQNHISGFTPYAARGKGKVVAAESENFVILGDFSEMELVEDAYGRLLKRCKNGHIVGISTTHLTDLGFFSWTNRVLMEGLCLK